ncbi:MAG TPA: retropepsin-like aspartic protease, partial [Vicinamibacterales bacterium]|nr:retropepsin-like aspartic protease [Vicinamibacterales bacterium]
MRRVQAFTLAALAFAGSGAGEAGGLAPRSSFSARSGEIVVPAFVNGSGPFLFLLDTGASHSAVSEELAGAVGAPAVARTKVMSTIGHDLRPVVRLDRLNVGPVTASGVLASVVRRDDIDPQGRIQGLIGQDVLASRRYTLDYRQRQVEWLTDAGQAMGGVKLRLHIDDGRSLVELPQDGSIVRLVPDSAADGLVL